MYGGFKNSGPDSGRCMVDYDSSEDGPQPEYYQEPEVPKKVSSIPDKWGPNRQQHVVRDEFSLGDIFQLWSLLLPSLSKFGDSEIHLGNKGFDGEVHENLFIII